MRGPAEDRVMLRSVPVDIPRYIVGRSRDPVFRAPTTPRAHNTASAGGYDYPAAGLIYRGGHVPRGHVLRRKGPAPEILSYLPVVAVRRGLFVDGL